MHICPNCVGHGWQALVFGIPFAGVFALWLKRSFTKTSGELPDDAGTDPS